MTITDEMRFPVRSHEDDWERPWRETESEHDLHSATVWCLHLRCGHDIASVEDMAQRILRSGAEILNGVYIGGDSFAEWAEVYEAQRWYFEHGRALHVYFTAPSLSNARVRGGTLARIAYNGRTESWLRVNCTVSTAADWSLQAEIV